MKFKRGDPKPPGSGRKRGTPNLFGKALKEALLRAAEEAGDTLARTRKTSGTGVHGYLCFLALNEPAVFGSMLRALIPHELKASGDGLPLLDVRVYTRAGQPANQAVVVPALDVERKS